jgi:hypothetical protein
MGVVQTNADGLRWHFGTRQTGDEANFGDAANPMGVDKELSIHLRGSDFTAGGGANPPYLGTTVIIPAGFTLREVIGEVTEVFVLGGTTPVINFGVQGSEATNRVAQVSEAQAEALGTYNLTATAAGTLAVNTPLAAQQTLAILLGGTNPTVTAAGRIVLTVRWQKAYGA